MMWRCKGCKEAVPSRLQLLNHYRLAHPHFGPRTPFPCTYDSCPCTFKTWNALIVHHSKSHFQAKEPAIFSCHLCDCDNLQSERDYFVHVNAHLKRNEMVSCMFLGCEFKTNIYSTFQTHKNRKHCSHSLVDFKPGVVISELSSNDFEEQIEEAEEPSDTAIPLSTGSDFDAGNLSKIIEQRFAASLLKLEHLVHVPSTAVDEFLGELSYLVFSASVPLLSKIVSDTLHERQYPVDESVVREIVDGVCSESPVQKSVQRGGPLSTAYLRKQYYKENFGVTEPVEYILDAKKQHSYQYVPLLKSLQQLLSRQDVFNKVVESHGSQSDAHTGQVCKYTCSRDGSLFKDNPFFAGGELRIALNFYQDDFEVCNPLGTSRRTHKLCAVYWKMGNLPPESHSSINLAILCRTDHVKLYGFDKIFALLLQDLKILEDLGVYVPLAGESVRGTVYSVVADNLGAHSVAGFVQNFSGDYYCRFCTGKDADIQFNSVASGAFTLRTKEAHGAHVKMAEQTGIGCYGVKKECVFTKRLSHFHVLFGYPPDIAHDIFEGIIPAELAHCLKVLIDKKFFTLADLNKAILNFPYKYTDRTNKPHVVSQSFSSSKTVGGNAHENWSLLRFLPFLIGICVPADEPAWLILMTLKDITELTVAPVHTDDSVAFLESKIIEHRQRFTQLFPSIRLLPKQHYLEHYPEMIRMFGPIVGQWTMRFESKHRYFKQIIKHTSCFNNVPLSLACKHQLMMGYHLSAPRLGKPDLEVSNVSTQLVDLLKEEFGHLVKQRFPDLLQIQLSKRVVVKGIEYKKGMILAHRVTNDDPEFGEIDQIAIMYDRSSKAWMGGILSITGHLNLVQLRQEH